MSYPLQKFFVGVGDDALVALVVTLGKHRPYGRVACVCVENKRRGVFGEVRECQYWCGAGQRPQL